ncbi:caspase family protein [Micromonospora sp. WMMD882]|uniref:caspase family protein n=1 Tax=Micromonospora sp. WMMD882 TaxID=3015151 RepID=UPI00248B6E71|nr:caspase family protein [Micromonospora sp. WMMD882]WBB80607.1 caspase family protein [Micromonospora sp. WMMD882]
MIGAQTKDLTGVDNDVRAMTGSLCRRGFAVEARVGADATRAGIIDAYESLIAEVGPDDTVFVYYSGHGGYLEPPEEPADGASAGMAMQFIVPTDYHESTDDDFRGVTAVELSVLQARLTRVTRNVTVALDCCHAAHMSRDPDLRVKALFRAERGAWSTTYERVAEHLAELRRGGLRVDLRHPVGDRHAVRLVACAPEQSAYEYTNRDGVRMGFLTEALTRALDDAGELPLTWHALMEGVRHRVLGLAPDQRPGVEGPSSRLLFTLTDSDPIVALPVRQAGPGRAHLPGAVLLGVQVDDEFAVVPADAAGPDAATDVGAARVDRVGGLSAQAVLRLRAPWTELPPGARAHRTRAAAPALPVRVPHPDQRTADLVAAIARSPLTRLAGEDEAAPVEVRIDADGYVLRDRIGPLHEPRPLVPAEVPRAVDNLERLARAAALRALSEDPRHTLDDPVAVEWGRVVAGRPSPLPTSGAVVYEGDAVYVRVRNDGPAPCHVSLVDIGVSARITVLTDTDQVGVRLAPGAEYVFGLDELDERLCGVPLSWPDGLAPDAGRLETILVLVTSTPQDVGLLQQGAVRSVPADRSPLEQLLAQVSTGGARDLTRQTGRAVRYAVRTIDFDLLPAAPPEAETARFLVDERPPPSARLLAPRGVATPTTVAVRLDELVVHRNRALGSADVRVDAVVLTGGGDPGRPVYRAQTERFSDIGDGQRLPLDRMLLYHGPAVDYLDIAVWVSRDSTGSLALSDLLRDGLTHTETQAAGAQLAGLVVAAPQAAAAVAAVGAGAVVINLAYRLLRGVVGNSIGLYRTSLLAHEEFGVGRHPARGQRRAQDFSFVYTVEAVG